MDEGYKGYKSYKGVEYITIKDVIEALKKRANIVILSTLIITFIVSIFVVFVSKPKYEATAKVFLGKDNQKQSDYTDKDLDSYLKVMDTYIELVKTKEFMNKIIKEADLDITAKELMDSVEFITKTNTPVIEISYTSKDKTEAKVVAINIINNFESKVKRVISNTEIITIDTIDVEKIPQGRAKKIIFAALLGLVIGCAIVFLLEFLDETISKKDDLEELLDIPVVGEIPLLTERKSKSIKNLFVKTSSNKSLEF